MTGWANLPAEAGADFHDLAFRAQFCWAIRERCLAACAPYTGYAESDDYSDDVGVLAAGGYSGDAFSIRHMQEAVAYLCQFYTRAGDQAGLLAAPYGYMPKQLFTDMGSDAAAIPDGDAGPAPNNASRLGDAYPIMSGVDNGKLQTFNGITWDITTPADGYTIGLWWEFVNNGSPAFYRRDAATNTWVGVEMGWKRRSPREIQSILDVEGPLWYYGIPAVPFTDGDRARLLANTTDEIVFYDDSWGLPYSMAAVGATPPPEPASDTSGMSLAYGVQAGATGDWAGHDGEVAHMPEFSWWGIIEPDTEPKWWVYDSAWENPEEWDGTWEFDEPDDGDKVLFAFNAAWICDGVENEWIKAGAICEFATDRWFRAETQGRPDTVTAYGLARPGDYIGAWLFNELYAALNLLTCRVSLRPDAAGGTTGYGKAVAGGGISWVAAKADAESDWAIASATATDSSDDIEVSSGGRRYSGTDWEADLCRVCSQWELHFSSAADYPDVFIGNLLVYVVGSKPYSYPAGTGTFDNCGDDVDDSSAVLWYTDPGVDGGLANYMAPLWNEGREEESPLGTWCSEPSSGVETSRGYVINRGRGGMFGVIDMAVAGGFEYVAEA